VWHLEVTKHLDNMLEDYIKQDSFKTKSEFIRGAVREKLEDETAKFSRNGFKEREKQRNDKNDRV